MYFSYLFLFTSAISHRQCHSDESHLRSFHSVAILFPYCMSKPRVCLEAG